MENNHTPDIRFAGFTGEWEQRKLIKLVTPVVREVPKPNRPYERISVRSHAKGTFRQKVDDPKTVTMDKLYVVKENDLIVNITFAWEHAIAVASKEDDGLLVSHRFPTFVIDKSDINFIHYSVSQENFRRKMELISPGGAGRNRVLNKKDFVNLKIDVPTQIEEQTKIGNFFKQLDDTIALHQQELTTLKQTKQGFLQKMFPKEGESVPKVRFPGFTGDWEERKLNTVFKDFIVPMRDKPKEFSGTVPWTRIEDIEGRFINGTTSGQYVSEETIKSMNLKIIPKGSLIVSASATFGVVAIVNNDLITNQTFIGLVPNTNYNIDYLYAFFKSSDIQKKMKRESAGSTIFYISRKQFEDMIGKFPGLEEQEKIGNFFKQLDDTITLHQRELEALKETKKAFLQKMFV